MLNIDIVDMGLHEDWRNYWSNESSFNTNTLVSFEEDYRITETMVGCGSETIEGASAAGSLTITTATISFDFILEDSIYFTLDWSYLKLFTVAMEDRR